jgi:hypothetical protein
MTDPRARAAAAKIELRETEKAFTDLRAALVEKLLATPAEAQKTRETCYAMVSALDTVKAALLQVIAGGQIEDALAERRDTTVILPIRGAA